jgi:hypothetical protein
MPKDSAVVINGETYLLVADSQLPKGKRAWTRDVRPSQPSDPTVQRVAKWALSGPIGQSNERNDGFLGVDYTVDMDTRYDDLLIPAAKPNLVSLDANDPSTGTLTIPFTIPATLGGFATDTVTNGMHYVEQQGQMVFGRGQALTVVDPSAMSVSFTEARANPVKGMVSWKGEGRIGFGAAEEVKSITSISGVGLNADTETGLYAGAMTIGADRWWAVDGSSGDENKVIFSLDNLTAISDPFPVNDDSIPVTGLGTIGPFIVAASEVGASSFTDLGKPKRLIEGVKDFRDPANGKPGDTLWGWYYQPTKLGLYAIIPGEIANPAGPESATGFEGEIDGYPTAVRAWKDSLWVAYLTTAGDTFILRGMFGAQTAQTGLPEWYPFAKISSARCDIIRGTNLRDEPTILVGTDSNVTYYTLALRGREIASSAYEFFTGTSKWFGSKMTRNSNMHKNIRYFVAVSEDVDASNTFQIAVSIDNGAYVDIGSPISSGNHKFVRPSSGGVPLTTVNGHTIKPRITCVSDDDADPPKLHGYLEMVYDERPDTIVEHGLYVRLANPEQDFERLRDLFNNHSTAAYPFSWVEPGDTTVKYGFIVDIQKAEDIAGDGVEAAMIRLQEWEV